MFEMRGITLDEHADGNYRIKRPLTARTRSRNWSGATAESTKEVSRGSGRGLDLAGGVQTSFSISVLDMGEVGSGYEQKGVV